MSNRVDPKPTLLTVPMEDALACINSYITTGENDFGIPQQNLLRCYLISAEELFDTLGVTCDTPKFPYLRVYLAKDCNGDEAKNMRLFLTPVNEDLVDQIPLNTDGKQYVYDFNHPCPNSCDFYSPLYTGR